MKSVGEVMAIGRTFKESLPEGDSFSSRSVMTGFDPPELPEGEEGTEALALGPDRRALGPGRDRGLIVEALSDEALSVEEI